MRDSERPAWTGETSRLLRELLTSRAEYRQLWQEQAERRRSDGISKAGAARVIALYLWGSGERSDSDVTLARDLKDRVRRALAGQSITPQTLAWFIEAFGMDPRDEQALWATFAGDRDRYAGISYTITSERELALRQRHRTVALFERYCIGVEGSFDTRRTLHTIMALEDGVDVYPFNHEPGVERIEVLHGGTLGRRYLHGNGLTTDAIMLENWLVNGQTVSLEYLARYPLGGYRATEVRRPAHGRTENVDMAVTFHEDKRPASVFWAVWPDHQTGSPISEERVPLDDHRRAHKFVRFIEETVVGFRWEW